MNDKPYEPIDCHFYDELEAAAVKRVFSTILYLNDENEEQVREGYIVDFTHINKAEYLVLKDGFKLRLDQIIQLNDTKAPSTTCNIKGSC